MPAHRRLTAPGRRAFAQTKLQKKQKQKRKGMAKTPDTVWYVAKHQNGKTYYVAIVDDENNSVLWTPTRKDAMHFHTERGVYYFMSTLLHSRTDVFLINGPVTK